MEKMKTWIIGAAGLVCAAISSNATTFNSDGTDCCGPSSVQAIHDAQTTHDGDTITLLAGTFSWTSTVSLTKAITLKVKRSGTMTARPSTTRSFRTTSHGQPGKKV